MPDPTNSSDFFEDDDFLDELVDFVEDYATKELYFYQKWNFSRDPFDQRGFKGPASSVRSRRTSMIKLLTRELLREFTQYNHILIKAPDGAGKSFLMQDLYGVLKSQKVNETLIKSLKLDHCNISFLNGYLYRDKNKQERQQYLIDRGIIEKDGQTSADIVIIDNFGPLETLWQDLYIRCFNQSFIIASLQTSEHVYLE
ncbi:MAG: hypothetical protein ACXAC7_21705, partial [Candidatus Hodarchaeales archaeon]